jgi:ABC-type sugar transport system substrate-binding protein/anti-anti-sigma regulatory factor
MATITENLDRRLAQDERDIFQHIVESSIDAILMTDSELQIAYSNRACNQLMARNVAGRSLTTLWFEQDLLLLNSAFEWARVGGFFSSARLNGFHSVIDRYPGIEIVGALAADWDREKGRQAAEEFLRANPPGALDAIWAASGEMGLGAMLAVEAAGRQDEIKIFTNDVTPESADRMREGRLTAETHHGFPEWGWYGTKFAVMLALGQDVPSTFDIRPRTMYKDNTDQFYPMPALEPIDWEGIKASQKLPEKIVIGWAPAAASGVFKTATEYFEKAAAEARRHGINVEIITQTPSAHVDFANQVAIIEDYVQRQVDAIAISAIEAVLIKPATEKAHEMGIPVIIVNQLEPIQGIEIASYIGFDNTAAGAISAYSVVDYLGGPGILGKGDKVEVEPGTYLDLDWWQALYRNVNPRTIDVKGRVAIIKGISGSWQGENRLVRSDGSVVYVDSVTFPVHDKAGQFIGMIASFREATQRKQAEEERARLQQEIIEAQERALQELSTPIIPIMERIIIMPLIGSIDTTRARDITRALLAGISEHRAKIVILDVTGVPLVDSGIADHLNKTIQAARLKGTQTIVTGLSDSVAETIVELGIDWSGVETLGDLRTGLVIALNNQGIKLTKILH